MTEANAAIDLASRAGVLSFLIAFVAVVLAGESGFGHDPETEADTSPSPSFLTRWFGWS